MSEKFTFTGDAFEGPLETLLNLIEERKLSISSVSLAQVADAYLSYVEKLPQLPLGETAQFILVASTLLLIKSRALLPTLQLTNSEEGSVQELEKRLARYAVIRKAAKLLRRQWGTHPILLAHRAPTRPAVFSPAEASPSTISQAGMRLVNMLPKPETMLKAVVAPVLALEDVIIRLKERLNSAFRAKLSELTKNKDRHETIVYFLAMLELVRTGAASISQEKLFEDITIEIENAGIPRYGAAL